MSEGIAMADLGYPRSGGGGDVPTPVVRREGKYIIWQNVCRKMHENETNWTDWESRGVPLVFPLPCIRQWIVLSVDIPGKKFWPHFIT